MNRPQAIRFMHEIKKLPEHLGVSKYFYSSGKPCCAVGHLAYETNFDTDTEDFKNMDVDFDVKVADHLRKALGLNGYEIGRMVNANDYARSESRRGNVLLEARAILAMKGYDEVEIAEIERLAEWSDDADGTP